MSTKFSSCLGLGVVCVYITQHAFTLPPRWVLSGPPLMDEAGRDPDQEVREGEGELELGRRTVPDGESGASLQ